MQKRIASLRAAHPKKEAPSGAAKSFELGASPQTPTRSAYGASIFTRLSSTKAIPLTNWLTASKEQKENKLKTAVKPYIGRFNNQKATSHSKTKKTPPRAKQTV